MQSSYWSTSPPRIRVISDNDYAGDPDGFLQLAQHALSPSVELVGVIASHLRPDDPFNPVGKSTENGARFAKEVLNLCGRSDVPVYLGNEDRLVDDVTPHHSPGAEFIVTEAMKDDPRPLYITLGAGLTELASAYLLEPRIADRIKAAVWIGGLEHHWASAPPGAMEVEYNLLIDIVAGQVVWNHSNIHLWQVPRDAYRQCLVSMAELEARLVGPLGEYMFEALDKVAEMCGKHGVSIGETYICGDSPLVLLTALQSSFEPDATNSFYRLMAAPDLDDKGRYTEGVNVEARREVRVYERIDVRGMMEDLFWKLARLEKKRMASA